MPKRTIAVMARLVDQKDGLGIYGQHLLRELLLADPVTRYIIMLRPRPARSCSATTVTPKWS